MRSENIVDLFKKYNVSHPVFDHLTADIDLNTFWVLRAILDAGYRPRSVAIEYNRCTHDPVSKMPSFWFFAGAEWQLRFRGSPLSQGLWCLAATASL
jgi:hypothetical protein